MKLSDEVKLNILRIIGSDEFLVTLYDGLDEDKRQELGQFYTPAELCIEMLESFKTDTFAGKNILDPCCGSGNLLIAMLIAGADPDRIYGNDIDSEAVKLCRRRINRACDILKVPHIQDWQIHVGDALDIFCITNFGPDYKKELEEHFYDLDDPLHLIGITDEHNKILEGAD